MRLRGKTLEVVDYSVIEEVEFQGISGVEDVRKVVRFLLVGKPISPSTFKSVRQLIIMRLRSLGFSRSKVFTSLRRGKCGYVATISVKKGSPTVIKSIRVEAIGDFAAKAFDIFSSTKGKAFNYQQLLKAKEELEGFLARKGYYNCSVSFRTVPIGEGEEELVVKVKTGKLYRVIFKGNYHFTSERLRKLLTFYSARSVDEFEIENSREKLVQFYRNNGFPFAKVSVRLIEKEKEVVVEFNVEEGPYVVVRSVEVKGFGLKEEELLPLKGKPFSEERVKSLLRRVVSYLKSRGYREASGSYKVEPSGSLVLKLKKGPIYEIYSLEVTGDIAGCFKEAKLPFPFTDSNVERLTGELSDCYASRGYPDARISFKTEELSRDPERVLLKGVVSVKSGSHYRFGYVVVRGLKRTELASVKNLLLISPGETYSRKSVIKQYSKLLDSKLFSSVNISEVRSDSTISEVVEVREGSLLKLKGFIGYGTDYGVVSNGFITMTSPLGLGLKFFLFGRYRQKEGYDAVFKVIKPAFPFSNWNISYSIVKKEQIYESFKSERLLYSLSLERKKSSYLSQLFRFDVSREEVRDTSILTKKYSLERRLVYLQTYDRRDSPSNPKRGYLSFTKLSLSGLFLGGGVDYALFEEKLLLLKTLGGITASIRLSGGAISSFNGSTVPLQDRFFLGGAESVRGYRYGTVSPKDSKGNFIGGKAYGLFSFEVRHRIKGKLEGALFYDSGRVFRELSDFTLSDWYSSVGVGIRYLTPVGPLRLDYGYKLKPLPGEGRGRFHISFGFPF